MNNHECKAKGKRMDAGMHVNSRIIHLSHVAGILENYLQGNKLYQFFREFTYEF